MEEVNVTNLLTMQSLPHRFARTVPVALALLPLAPFSRSGR
jgi:hypothetical protein